MALCGALWVLFILQVGEVGKQERMDKPIAELALLPHSNPSKYLV